MKISLAQIEVIPGDLEANYNKIKEYYYESVNNGSNVVAFPEACVSGYFLGDIWETNFIYKCEEYNKKIIDLTKDSKTAIIFGSICTFEFALRSACGESFDKDKTFSPFYGEDGRVKKINASITAFNGSVIQVSPKFSQPNYREFEDDRHFYSGRDLMLDFNNFSESSHFFGSLERLFYRPFVVSDGKGQYVCIRTMLCEDGWDDDYSFSPYNFTSKGDVIINCSCSPFTKGKNSKRNRLFGNSAEKRGNTIFYVNNVGIQNTGKNVFVFDGDSNVYNPNGCKFENTIHDMFEERIMEFDLFKVNNFWIAELNRERCDGFKVDNSPIAILHKALTYGTKKFCESIGVDKIVIGASGGIDSALNSAIYAQFIKPNNLYLVNMPSKFNSITTKSAANKLANNLGCSYIEFPIQDHVDMLVDRLEAVVDDVSSFNKENIQARFRSSSVLAAVSSIVGGVFTCNANKSETVVGYSTLYGDGSGFFANLADLWKGSEIYELASWHNENIANVIPIESIEIKPSAELSDEQNVDNGQGDPLIYNYHDKLFASWVEKWDRMSLDETLERYVSGELGDIIGCHNIYEIFDNFEDFENDARRWWKLYTGLSVAKRIQGPPVLTLSRRAIGGTDCRESQGVVKK